MFLAPPTWVSGYALRWTLRRAELRAGCARIALAPAQGEQLCWAV